jgi:hypothetical protein
VDLSSNQDSPVLVVTTNINNAAIMGRITIYAWTFRLKEVRLFTIFDILQPCAFNCPGPHHVRKYSTAMFLGPIKPTNGKKARLHL